MQARCIKAFGVSVPGDVVGGLPDGAQVDPEHWELIPDEPAAPAPTTPASSPVTPAAAVTPKEGM